MGKLGDVPSSGDSGEVVSESQGADPYDLLHGMTSSAVGSQGPDPYGLLDGMASSLGGPRVPDPYDLLRSMTNSSERVDQGFNGENGSAPGPFLSMSELLPVHAQ